MKLPPADRITAWLIDLPMSHAFSSAQTTVARRRLVVLRVESEGAVGWGEAAPVAGHTRESPDRMWGSLRHLLAAHGTDAGAHAAGLLRGAFTQAADDRTARAHHLPLWRMLGSTQQFAASAAIGLDQTGQPDRKQLAEAAAAGYGNVKLKVTPATELHLVQRLVQEYDGILFGADANGSLGRAHREFVDGLDSLGLAYLEQPGDPGDLEYHRALRRRLQTPIALDESAAEPDAIDSIVQAEAADLITLKVGRLGASVVLDHARRIVSAGVGVRLGGLLESGVGRAHAAAIAGHSVFSLPGDVAGSDQYFSDDLVRPQWRAEIGLITVPDEPGIGVVVDTRALDAYSVATLSSVDSG